MYITGITQGLKKVYMQILWFPTLWHSIFSGFPPHFPVSLTVLNFFSLILQFRKTESFCLRFRCLSGDWPPWNRCIDMKLTIFGSILSRTESILLFLPVFDHSSVPLNYCWCVYKIICLKFKIVNSERFTPMQNTLLLLEPEFPVDHLKTNQKERTVLSCSMESVFHVTSFLLFQNMYKSSVCPIVKRSLITGFILFNYVYWTPIL